jgi:hypothetical protein
VFVIHTPSLLYVIALPLQIIKKGGNLSVTPFALLNCVLFTQPLFWDRFMRPHKVVLIAPSCIGGFRSLIEFVVGVAKDESQVNTRMLLTDKLVLLSIFQVKDAFGFDIKKATIFLW